jgi:aspartate racemase
MKKIGVIAACVGGFEAFYSTLIRYSLMRHHSTTPHVCIDQAPLQNYFSAFEAPEKEPLLKLLLSSLDSLKHLGVDFAVIPNNSAHSVIEQVIQKSPLPILNLLEVVGEECRRLGFKKVLILGISKLLQSGLYQRALQSRQIASLLLPENEGLILHKEIMMATMSGAATFTFSPELEQIIDRHAHKSHCDAVLLACSDLVKAYHGDLPIPSIDPMELLAHRAIDRAFTA